MELIELYERMAKARAFELALADLWQQGHISGEMHLGTGEEAVIAGISAHMKKGDAAAIDHRSTPMLTLLGVDMVLMLKEMLGHEDGLCGGWGGHMHLMSPEHLAAASGIVGAAGPTACGFALAAKSLRPKSVAIALFGDGAINEGMLLESLNLAVALKLPVIFVCKDNEWAVTTRSQQVTGGDIRDRAESFGMRARDVDGLDALAVYKAADDAFKRARRGKGPTFIRAKCSRLDGHYLGDLLVRMARHPIGEGKETFGKVISAALSRKGSGLGKRVSSMAHMMDSMRRVKKLARDTKADPLVRARKKLSHSKESKAAVKTIDEAAQKAVADAVQSALGEVD